MSSEGSERLIDYAERNGVLVADKRGVTGTLCRACSGWGVRDYPSSATWRKDPVAMRVVTRGQCDRCWGSGDAEHPWPNLRRLRTDVAVIEYVGRVTGLAQLSSLCGYVVPVAQVTPWRIDAVFTAMNEKFPTAAFWVTWWLDQKAWLYRYAIRMLPGTAISVGGEGEPRRVHIESIVEGAKGSVMQDGRTAVVESSDMLHASTNAAADVGIRVPHNVR